METVRTSIEQGGVKLEVAFDGFCLTVSSDEKFIFVGSVNDPEVDGKGNACLLFFNPDEIAVRMEEHYDAEPKELCLVTDGHLGICNMAKGHDGVTHEEVLEDGTLWSQWRSIVPEDEDRKAPEYIPVEKRMEIPE